MIRKTRFQQDAVIAMAIIVVLLLIWRLRSHPQQFGGGGGWMTTNIFGSSGSGLLPGLPQDGTTNGSEAAAPPPSPSNESSNQPLPTTETEPETGISSTNKPATTIADLDITNAPMPSAATVVDAATMEKRLGEVGAKTGDIQFSLFWRNFNDLDLHCIDPKGEEIYYNNKVSSLTGGTLDVDQNASPPYNRSPVENIFWPAGGAPPGLYRLYVVFYAQHDSAYLTPFTVRTVVRGKTNMFSGTIAYTGHQERYRICSLRYDPQNPNPSMRYRFVQE